MQSSQNTDEKPEVFTNSLQHTKTLTPNPVFLQGEQLRSLCSCPSGFPLMFSPETLEYCEYCTMHSLEVGKGLRIFHTRVSGLPPLWLPTFWNSPFNGQLPSQPKLHHLISQDQKKKKSSRADHFRDQEVTSGRSTSCISRELSTTQRFQQERFNIQYY